MFYQHTPYSQVLNIQPDTDGASTSDANKYTSKKLNQYK
jgi:hypothetical protein